MPDSIKTGSFSLPTLYHTTNVEWVHRGWAKKSLGEFLDGNINSRRRQRKFPIECVGFSPTKVHCACLRVKDSRLLLAGHKWQEFFEEAARNPQRNGIMEGWYRVWEGTKKTPTYPQFSVDYGDFLCPLPRLQSV